MAALLTTLRSTTAVFDPLTITGLTHWWDFSSLSNIFTDTGATTPVTADGDSIKAVTDKKGSITLTEATNPPLYKTGANGINSQGVGLWNGTNTNLKSGNFTQAQSYTVVVVAKHATGTLGGTVERLVTEVVTPNMALEYATAAAIGSGSNSRLLEYAGTVTSVPDATALDTSTHIIVAIYNGASSQLWLDGVQQTLTPGNPGAGNLTTASGLYIGTFNGSTVFNGRIAQVMTINGAISTADRDSLETKWGGIYGFSVT